MSNLGKNIVKHHHLCTVRKVRRCERRAVWWSHGAKGGIGVGLGHHWQRDRCTNVLSVYIKTLPVTLNRAIDYQKAVECKPGVARVISGGAAAPAEMQWRCHPTILKL